MAPKNHPSPNTDRITNSAKRLEPEPPDMPTINAAVELPQIFRGYIFYIQESSEPHIEHAKRLKGLIRSRGGASTSSPEDPYVTHILVGRENDTKRDIDIPYEDFARQKPLSKYPKMPDLVMKYGEIKETEHSRGLLYSRSKKKVLLKSWLEVCVKTGMLLPFRGHEVRGHLVQGKSKRDDYGLGRGMPGKEKSFTGNQHREGARENRREEGELWEREQDRHRAGSPRRSYHDLYRPSPSPDPWAPTRPPKGPPEHMKSAVGLSKGETSAGNSELFNPISDALAKAQGPPTPAPSSTPFNSNLSTSSSRAGSMLSPTAAKSSKSTLAVAAITEFSDETVDHTLARPPSSKKQSIPPVGEQYVRIHMPPRPDITEKESKRVKKEQSDSPVARLSSSAHTATPSVPIENMPQEGVFTSYGIPDCFYILSGSQVAYTLLIEKMGGGAVVDLASATYIVIDIPKEVDRYPTGDEEISLAQHLEKPTTRSMAVSHTWIEESLRVGTKLVPREFRIAFDTSCNLTEVDQEQGIVRSSNNMDDWKDLEDFDSDIEIIDSLPTRSVLDKTGDANKTDDPSELDDPDDPPYQSSHDEDTLSSIDDEVDEFEGSRDSIDTTARPDRNIRVVPSHHQRDYLFLRDRLREWLKSRIPHSRAQYVATLDELYPGELKWATLFIKYRPVFNEDLPELRSSRKGSGRAGY